MNPWLKKTATLVTVTLLAASTQQSGAEEADAPLGARVRVRLSALGHRKPLVGTVVQSDAQKLTLDLGAMGGTVVVPRESVAKLEFSRGKQSRSRGALIGAMAGALVTGVLAATSHSTCTGDPPCLDLDFSSTYVLFGVGAVATGAAIGASVQPGEHWETVRRGAQVSVSF
jgi:hypothetical protein